MSRHLPVFLAFLAACAIEEEPTVDVAASGVNLAFARAHVSGDIYHYELTLPVGEAPNAALRIHRVVREGAPYVPRRGRPIMMVHGDFTSFDTIFAGGLAPYLAARGFDVWGVDRRWTLPGPTDDISDLAEMGVAQELDDLGAALGFARGIRLVTGQGAGRFALLGYSHGGQLAYHYAAIEAARPAPLRHVGALVPVDWYGAYGPDQEDARAITCQSAADQYGFVELGVIDATDSFFNLMASLARTAPDEASPLFGEPFTNRTALLLFVAETWQLGVPFAPAYHLLARGAANSVPMSVGDALLRGAAGFAQVDWDDALTWLEDAPPHQSMLEGADLDAMLCGDAPPVDAPLSAIEVPIYYLGAAGGVGALGEHTLTLVSSTDVTSHVVSLGTGDPATELGHADLLLGRDAPALAWEPLAAWLAAH